MWLGRALDYNGTKMHAAGEFAGSVFTGASANNRTVTAVVVDICLWCDDGDYHSGIAHPARLQPTYVSLEEIDRRLRVRMEIAVSTQESNQTTSPAADD
jgi:hypothetical protein